MLAGWGRTIARAEMAHRMPSTTAAIAPLDMFGWAVPDVAEAAEISGSEDGVGV